MPQRRKTPGAQARSQRRGAQPERMQPAAPLGEGYRAELARVHPIPGVALLPLRLFLSVTFIYAGIQKLADPGFFAAGSRTYIGSQITAFGRGSPIHFLMQRFAEHAVAIGILTIATEMVVGALVLLGLLTRMAALIGLILNLIFFLSASWQTYPYFFGSDIVFVMCWLTLALAGPGAWALDTLVQPALRVALEARAGRRLGGALQTLLVGPVYPGLAPGWQEMGATDGVEAMGRAESVVSTLTRREALAGAVVALGLIILGLVQRGGGASSAVLPGGGPLMPRLVGNIDQLPANGAREVLDPKTGDPIVIVRTTGLTVYAYNAICTHARCTVHYDPRQNLLICPCHGGAFDPTKGARVVAGPPPAPLSPVRIKVDSQGNIYI